jgi:galactonate dehydratase
MKVTGVEVKFAAPGRRCWVFVKLTTDEGIHGWGEAGVEGKEWAVAGAVRDLGRYIIGKDPFRIEEHWWQMFRGAYWSGGPILNSAISGIEHCLWDIKGKALGLPVYELIGGKCHDKVRAYANAWFRSPDQAQGAKTPLEFARYAEAAVKRGYTALKWDPFGGSGLFIEQDDADLAVAIVKEVRNAVGPKVDLLIEVHGRLSPANAIRIAHRLEEFNPFFYEEPIPCDNIDAMAMVARSINIPVATGERLYTRWGFKDLLEKQAAAIIQPDICHDGGIMETKKIAAMAEVYYVALAPHNPNGPLSTAASVQVDCTCPNFLIQEHVISDEPLYTDIQKEPLKAVDGYFTPPSTPGLGVDLNEELLHDTPPTHHDMYDMVGPSRKFRWD